MPLVDRIKRWQDYVRGRWNYFSICQQRRGRLNALRLLKAKPYHLKQASERLSGDMVFSAEPYAASRAGQHTVSALGFIHTIGFCDDLSRWVQPPDAENRTSDGAGGITGAILLSQPDRLATETD